MALSRITEAVASFTDLTIGDDLTLTDDFLMASDASIIKFGADADVTLTHVHNTGLLLNSTSVIQFNDASQNIGAPSATVLDINATDEIELNATLIDVNGNLDVSGTIVAAGALTAATSITVGNAALTEAELETLDGITAGTAAASKVLILDANKDIGTIRNLTIDGVFTDGNYTFDTSGNVSGLGTVASGNITSSGTISGTVITSSDSFVPNGANGASLGTASLEFSDLFLHDGAVINLGADQDVTLTHVADTGILLNSSRQLQFGDSGTYIHQSGDGILDLVADSEIEINATTIDINGNVILDADITVGDDLKLLSDSALISFGADTDIHFRHVADVGLILKNTNSTDDKPIVLTLQTGETDMAANDVMGAIRFQAPDEGTGTDAILVAAAIQAVSEGDFSASSNATRLEFHTGASEAASSKMTLSSAGLLTIADDLVIKDGGTIGVTSDADAITIASNGVVTFSQAVSGTSATFDGGVTIDGITIDGTQIDLSSGDLTLDVAGDIILDAAGNEIKFHDDGTLIGFITLDNTDITLQTSVSDRDIIFKGNDGGSTITALSLDMSSAGDATFNQDIFVRNIYGNNDANTGIQWEGSDVLTFHAGGVENIQLTSSATVFNQDSADMDFRIESNGLGNMFFVDAGENKVYIGRDTNDGKFGSKLQIESNDSTAGMSLHRSTNDTGPPYLAMSKSRNSNFGDDTIVQNGDGLGTIYWSGADGTDRASGAAFISAEVDGVTGENDMPGRLIFATTLDGANSPTERMRIKNYGGLLIGSTNASPAEGSTAGTRIGGVGATQISVTGQTTLLVNRVEDGTVVSFHSAGTVEGSVSISGTTTSYNAFSGSHWSRLTDNSKPTILKGTIIETIDEMCDWYQAEFTKVAEVENGVEVLAEEKGRRTPIALPDGKSVGDTISITYEDVTYDNAVIVKEDDNKHTKCKISDTADSKRVYGVFAAFDNDDDTVNDMYVTAVGTHVVRINKDVTVSAGDLLASNGDGTAKVQDDDIIRSKTIGKVLTNIKQETYSDESYTVPCALYCG